MEDTNKPSKSVPGCQQTPGHAQSRQRLEALRSSVLALHKSLVESERIEYERTMGRIQSPNHFLQLLTTDPWFAWLSPLSQLIVSMDEALDPKEQFNPAKVESLLAQTGKMLVASEEGDGFSHHYHDALQRDPDVVMAHAQVAKVRQAPKYSN